MQSYADSNKGNLSLKKMLSHYAKLQAWIPFYQNTLNNFDEYYRTTASAEFSIPVTENLFLRSDYKDSIFMQIKESELRTEDEYKYSDLPFYILRDYLEELYGSKMDELTEDFFYSSMGLKNLKYFPLNHFKYNQIAPSEKDTLWRKQIIKGTVHDQGAAMLGGIGGHAGLFGNVEDVAKMMLMYLNGGDYAGKQYLRPSTIDKFNTCYYCEEEVRRGIVFDKPQLEDEGPTCGCLSMKSFGHSGFTGTYAWADPEEEIVYVFLSNRTFPDASNAKLIESNARTRIQEVIYDALLK
jgi:CubicO group peptidase (beta-lactamase class C family)